MIAPIIELEGAAIPLLVDDVDTDQIIPAQYLKGVRRTGLGRHAFAAWRRDPRCVLNDPRYQGASILITGRNFGCGSSREHAVWALAEMGIRVVIAPSFADIFQHNCASVGILTVHTAPERCRQLAAASEAMPGTRILVDLRRQQVHNLDGWGGFRFEIHPETRRRLMLGLDPIDATLRREAAIHDYEGRRPGHRPTTRTEGRPS